jgi:hypothetical protein
LGGPLSKLCVTTPFSINFRCQIENQVSDYRLLGASSFIFIFYLFIFLNKNHDNILELKKDKNAQNKLNAFCLLPI